MQICKMPLLRKVWPISLFFFNCYFYLVHVFVILVSKTTETADLFSLFKDESRKPSYNTQTLSNIKALYFFRDFVAQLRDVSVQS